MHELISLPVQLPIAPEANPYIGPRVFREEEGALFFGRQREAEDLRSLVLSEQVVIFYAQSGAGKSSLVNARLRPELRAAGFRLLATARVNSALTTTTIAATNNVFILNLLFWLDENRHPAATLDGQTLASYFAREQWITLPTSVEDDEDELPAAPAMSPMLLVIDQFEELFTTHLDKWAQREGFFRQVRATLQAAPHLHLLLVMREDFVANLDPYNHLLPDKVRARFYMQRMEKNAAQEAIEEPAAQYGRPFAAGIASQLVDNLSQVRMIGATTSQTGQYIEPVQLQAVCYRLWENLKARPLTPITAQDLQEAGDIDIVLAAYYEDALRATLAQLPDAVSEAQLRTWFGEQLITETGTRGFVMQGRTHTGNLPNAVVDWLADNHFLVRREARAGRVWCELAHDRFIEPILKVNHAWEQRHQHPLVQRSIHWLDENRAADRLLRGEQLAEAQAQFEAAPQEFDDTVRDFLRASQQAEQQSKTQRQWVMTIAASFAILILSGLTVWALWTSREVNNLNLVLNAEKLTTTGLRAVGEAPQRGILIVLEGVNTQRKINKAVTVSAENNFRDLLQQVGGTPLRAYEGAFTPMVYRSAPLVVSPNGRWLATTSFDPFGTVRSDPRIWLWRLTNPETPPQWLTGHITSVTALAFSPNNQWLASASVDKTIRLWPIDQPNTQPYTLTGHIKLVTTVAFSPDSHWLASAGRDNTVRLWDVTNPRSNALNLGEQEEGVNALLFSPNGRWLADAKDDGTVQIWSMAEPKLKPRLLGQHDRRAIVLAFSPDERWLASASADATIRLWDLTNLDAKPRVLAKHTQPIWALAFSPNGHYLASGSRDRTVLLWDMTNPTADPRILYGHEDYVTSVAFSPDGHWLASASVDKTVRLWDMSNPVALPQVLRGHDGHVIGVVFSPDGQWLISAGRDQIIRLWEMSNLSAEPRVLSGHAAPVNMITFSPDKRWLASVDADGATQLWSTTKRTNPQTLTSGQNAVTGIAFSPDGRWLAGAGRNGSVQLWTGVNLTQTYSLTGHVEPVTALAFSPDEEMLASADVSGTVQLWAMANLTMTHTLSGNARAVNMVAFSPDKHWLASAGMDNTVRLWDLTNLAIEPRLLHEFKKPVWSIAFSPDGKWLASGSGDTTVGVWSMANPTETTLLTGHTDDVAIVAFSPDGQWLATASLDWTVRLWSVGNWSAKPRILSGHASPILSMSFSPDGQWLATSAFDRTIRRWDMTDLSAESLLLRGHTDAVNSLAFSPDGRWLASGSDDQTIRLWTMPIKELIDKACLLTGRNLTKQEWVQYFGTEAYHQTCPQWPIDS